MSCKSELVASLQLLKELIELDLEKENPTEDEKSKPRQESNYSEKLRKNLKKWRAINALNFSQKEYYYE